MPIQYLNKGPMSFGYGTKNYRDNWERMFSGKAACEEASQEDKDDPDDDAGAGGGAEEPPDGDSSEG